MNKLLRHLVLCKWFAILYSDTPHYVKYNYIKVSPGADAINIYGLLNPKKLGNFNNQML